MRGIAERKSSAPPATPAVLYVQAAGQPRPGLAERLAPISTGGAPALIATDIGDALRLLVTHRAVCLIVDLASDRVAATSIRLLRARHPRLPIVGILDAAGSVVAAEALQSGVTDLVVWPFDATDLATAIANARDRASAPGGAAAADVGWATCAVSPVMRPILDLVRHAAESRAGIAVSGEAGSGRQWLARAVHAVAEGRPDTWVTVDCAHETPAGLERHLFGVVTDRQDAAAGTAPEPLSADSAVARASGGTLFLSGLVDAPARVQIRLARILRDREGLADRGKVVDLDVRLIASFEGPVDDAVADGRLRRELADRLAIRIEVPPLRRRREDIPLLAVQLVQEAAARHGGGPRSLSRAALTLLAALAWPGNARELATLAGSLVRDTRRPIIQLEDVLEHARLDGVSTRDDAGLTLREARMRFERECITAMLLRHHGRVGEAARALGIQRTNLYRKVRQLKVDRSLLSARRP
jgi:DNA-binding NtrC family response regulator